MAKSEQGALPAEARVLLAGTKLLALDVDGVLTDGRVVYVGDEELQAFSVHDGYGLNALAQAGVTIAWITGRGCLATERRAAELGIQELHMRAGPKDAVLARIQERLGLEREHTVAMGDDLPDLLLSAQSGLFCAPANARPEVLAAATLVTKARGGDGAVRELTDLILSEKRKASGQAGG